MSVVLLGDRAVASGFIEAGWTDEQANLQRSIFRFLAVLRNQKSEWKLAATQSTKFGQPATPAEPLKRETN